MKIIDVIPLQEPDDTQFGLKFKQAVKKMMLGLGYKKGDRIALYRHGSGFFFERTETPTEREKLIRKSTGAEE